MTDPQHTQGEAMQKLTSQQNNDQQGDGPDQWGGNSTLLRVLGKFLPPIAKTEKANEYDGVLSTFEEHHSLYLGIGIGYAGGPAEQQALANALLFGWSGAKGSSKLNDDPHIHDAIQEPAYAAFGLTVGKMLKANNVALPALDSLPL